MPQHRGRQIPWVSVLKFHKDIVARAEQSFFAINNIMNDQHERWTSLTGFNPESMAGPWQIERESIQSQQFLWTLEQDRHESIFMGGPCYCDSVRAPRGTGYVQQWRPLLYREVELRQDNGFFNILPKQGVWNLTPLLFNMIERLEVGVPYDDFAAKLIEKAAAYPHQDNNSLALNIFKAFFSEVPAAEEEMKRKIQRTSTQHQPSPWVFFAPTNSFSPMTRHLVKDYECLEVLLQNNQNNKGGFALLEDIPRIKNLDPTDMLPFVPLNEQQKRAAQSILDGNPLTVISGPPGTGKSQVVVSILLNAWACGKTVLFASNNNKAVDVVRERVDHFESEFPIAVRAGSQEKQNIHEVLRRTLNMLSNAVAATSCISNLGKIKQQRQLLIDKNESLREALNSNLPQRINEARMAILKAYGEYRSILGMIEEAEVSLQREREDLGLSEKTVFQIEQSISASLHWVESIAEFKDLIVSDEKSANELKEEITRIELQRNRIVREIGLNIDEAGDWKWLATGPKPDQFFNWEHRFRELINNSIEEKLEPLEWKPDYNRWRSVKEAEEWILQSSQFLGTLVHTLSELAPKLHIIKDLEEKINRCKNNLLSIGILEDISISAETLVDWSSKFAELTKQETTGIVGKKQDYDRWQSEKEAEGWLQKSIQFRCSLKSTMSELASKIKTIEHLEQKITECRERLVSNGIPEGISISYEVLSDWSFKFSEYSAKKVTSPVGREPEINRWRSDNEAEIWIQNSQQFRDSLVNIMSELPPKILLIKDLEQKIKKCQDSLSAIGIPEDTAISYESLANWSSKFTELVAKETTDQTDRRPDYNRWTSGKEAEDWLLKSAQFRESLVYLIADLTPKIKSMKNLEKKNQIISSEMSLFGIPQGTDIPCDILADWSSKFSELTTMKSGWFDLSPWSRKSQINKELYQIEMKLRRLFPLKVWTDIGTLNDESRHKFAVVIETTRRWLEHSCERQELEDLRDGVEKDIKNIRRQATILQFIDIPLEVDIDSLKSLIIKCEKISKIAQETVHAWRLRSELRKIEAELCPLLPQNVLSGIGTLNNESRVKFASVVETIRRWFDLCGERQELKVLQEWVNEKFKDLRSQATSLQLRNIPLELKFDSLRPLFNQYKQILKNAQATVHVSKLNKELCQIEKSFPHNIWTNIEALDDDARRYKFSIIVETILMWQNLNSERQKLKTLRAWVDEKFKDLRSQAKSLNLRDIPLQDEADDWQPIMLQCEQISESAHKSIYTWRLRKELCRIENVLRPFFPSSVWADIGNLNDVSRYKFASVVETTHRWIDLNNERKELKDLSEWAEEKMKGLRSQAASLQLRNIPMQIELDAWRTLSIECEEIAKMAHETVRAWGKRTEKDNTEKIISQIAKEWGQIARGLPLWEAWRRGQGSHFDQTISQLSDNPTPQNLIEIRGHFYKGILGRFIDSWQSAFALEEKIGALSIELQKVPASSERIMEWWEKRPANAIILEGQHTQQWPDIQDHIKIIDTIRDWCIRYNMFANVVRPNEEEKANNELIRAVSLLGQSVDALPITEDRESLKRIYSIISKDPHIEWPVKELAELFSEFGPERIKTEMLRIEAKLEKGSFEYAKAQWIERMRSDEESIRAVHELEKCRGQIVLKDYEKNFKSALRAVPIWITTAQSASAIPLEPELFDIVIIDEASQCTLTNLLPLIYRGRTLAVIGDDNQLPAIPTIREAEELSLARKHGIEEHLFLLGHSTLNLYKSAVESLPRRRADIINLIEHFRSHPQIIAFSNRHIYSQRLELKKDPNWGKRLPIGSGVHVKEVNGYAKRGKNNRSWMNEIEAQAVVTIIQDLKSGDSRSLSLGVVTPFSAQKEIIRERLEKLQLSTDVLVDTASGFQGDERDVIIFSPTVSKGITKDAIRWVEKPPNLINVSLTRAREVLFCVGDINFCLSQDGLLRKLALYCKEIQLLRNTSPAELELFSWMLVKGWNPKVHPRIGDIEVDFTLNKDDGVQIVIEVDGSKYHNDTKEKDKARDAFLYAQGYEVFRTNARDVLETPNEVIHRIEQQIMPLTDP